MEELSDIRTNPEPGGIPPFERKRPGPLSRALIALSSGERMLLYVLTIALAGSAFFLLTRASELASTTVPSQGGQIVEGAIGTPRFINPLLAVSQTDQDLTALVYSGLMRADTNDLIPDIASGYEVSEDGTTYTFRIRDGVVFHDGTPVRAEDVAFTVALAQNEGIKSPRRADWEGVKAEAPDEHTVVFTLPHPYAPFLENTQLGILPKHLWEGISAEDFPFHELNRHPIGSGPFAITDITSDKAGSPVAYELFAFKWFALGRPNIDSIVFNFYPNEQALKNAFAQEEVGSFAGIALSQEEIQNYSGAKLILMPSTRIFGIFFNQNRAPVLADAAVRKSLEAAIDRTELIEKNLDGYGREADGPIPPGLLAAAATISTSTTLSTDRATEARTILTEGGWKLASEAAASSTEEESETEEPAPTEIAEEWTKGGSKLSFALSTADTPELAATAEAVAEAWRAAGASVNVQVYPLAEFNSTVLRPRAYDAVLFGEVVGRSLDLFAFWHSSQRNDPGLNLALYADAQADKLLASARAATAPEEREELYRSFLEVIRDDKPAVFLYAPEFTYVVPRNLEGLEFGALASPSERFFNVHEWYTDTEHVWNILSARPEWADIFRL